MDAQELRNLQEAYNQVHQVDEELTGARKQKASDLLDRKLRDVETLRKLSARKRQKPEDVGSGNRAKRRAGKEVKDSRIAVSDSYDYYDIILSHLLDEGYAETPEAAEAIMVNMSEEWRDVIVEAAVDWDMSSDEMEKARNERKFGKQGFNQAGQTQLRRRLHKSERGMKKQDVRRWNGEK